jgi:hypothetical protein
MIGVALRNAVLMKEQVACKSVVRYAVARMSLGVAAVREWQSMDKRMDAVAGRGKNEQHQEKSELMNPQNVLRCRI